ncbi:hypothetical protein FHS89_001590 [Rubricella aquisinus]|uniref:Uncharacterized protein n=1 Tax=Rubricella aquisinus TaxID=2028108 RepID=A0A840WKF7_9RHOB|nr:hypothetical protein [Rubricella aquisinus]MBB5515578.1 hypothetical protein [Rubricella aquisinus]
MIQTPTRAAHPAQPTAEERRIAQLELAQILQDAGLWNGPSLEVLMDRFERREGYTS